VLTFFNDGLFINDKDAVFHILELGLVGHNAGVFENDGNTIIDGVMDIFKGGIVNNNDGGVIQNNDAVIIQRTGTLNNNPGATFIINGTFIFTGTFNADGTEVVSDPGAGIIIDESQANDAGIVADTENNRIFVFNQGKTDLELSEMIIGLDSNPATKKTEPFKIPITAFLGFGGIFNVLSPTDLPSDSSFAISIIGESTDPDPTRGNDPVKKKFKSKTMIK